jgi:hypothetical protein
MGHFKKKNRPILPKTTYFLNHSDIVCSTYRWYDTMRMRKEYLEMILIKGVVKVDKKIKVKNIWRWREHYENRKRT